MTRFKFQNPDARDSSPQEWLRVWPARYRGYSEEEYSDLIAKHKPFSAQDFEPIGKWKDDVTTKAQWKPNVASVAYLIWMQAAQELPQCPVDGDATLRSEEHTSELQSHSDLVCRLLLEKKKKTKKKTTQ